MSKNNGSKTDSNVEKEQIREVEKQVAAKDEPCEKLEDLALQKEKAEQHVVELERQIYMLGDKGTK